MQMQLAVAELGSDHNPCMFRGVESCFVMGVGWGGGGGGGEGGGHP